MRFFASTFLLAAFASFATAAVTYDVGQHTWTLASGPVIYRLHQDGKAVELQYFGPSGRPAWPAATLQTGPRYELSATVEGQNIEDRDWELIDHQEQPESLLLVFRHSQTPLVVEARYSTYGDTGVISRELTVVNKGNAAVRLLAMDSLNWRLPFGDYDLSYLYGGAAAERQLMTEKLSVGIRSFVSGRGRSSALYAAWFALRNQTLGVQYAAQLAWSGNWEMSFNREVMSARRAVSGAVTAEMRLRNDFGGAMAINPGQTVPLPLAAFTASGGDLEDAANQLHRYQRHFVIPRTGINRPLVSQFNSWYPFRANFNEDQLKYGVKVAKDLGLDAYVIDDGWFPRDAQGHELFGDWEADPKIFQQGMPEFAQYVHSNGLKFGIWVEMELGAFGSKVYKEHPDWFLTYLGKPITSNRGPYMNYDKPEVRAWARGVIDRLVNQYKVDWIKFDYNVDYGERFDASDGGVLYRHVMGLYRFFDDIRRAYPKVIFENCSSGGRRLDLGMISRTNTSWLSDDINPKDSVQLAYGCTIEFTPEVCNHWMVGDKPGGSVDLSTPPGWWDFMFRVPMNGQYGISSRVDQWSPEFKNRAAQNATSYKAVREVIADADVYHLTSPPAHDNPTGWMALQYVAEDGRRSVTMAYRLSKSEPELLLKPRGLQPALVYSATIDGVSGGKDSGAAWMSRGLPVHLDAEWRSAIVEFTVVP